MKHRLIVIFGLVIGLIVGFVGGTAFRGSTSIQQAEQFKTLPFFDQGSISIPNDWSVYSQPEAPHLVDTFPPENYEPFLSVGQDTVAFGDMNWTQVDFFSSDQDIAAKLVSKSKATDPDSTWTKETVGGFTADVETAALDPAGASKAGSGGKIYYFSLAEADLTRASIPAQTLVIVKQAKGDEAFETGFNHLIRSLKFAESQLE